jgi:hypothetical protein
MAAWAWILIVLAVLVVAALVAWNLMSRRRTTHLQARFGPEYDRTMREQGVRRKAEGELRDRERRRDAITLVVLSPAARDRYRSRWHDVQAMFVDEPADAVSQADGLVNQVMQERGYPMADFEQRTADISVDHPEVVERYRAAHGIALAQDAGHASTDDLREAMIHYRALFDELLIDDQGETRTGDEPTDESGMRRAG